MIKPRPYQIKAVESTLDVLFNEPDQSPLVAMPTGTGKAAVIGWTMRAVMQRIPHARMLNAAHVKELLAQNSSELQHIWANAPFGIYSAGLKSKQAAMPITFASIQSAVRNLPAFGKQNILFIDEAHLLSSEEETNYQKLIKALREQNPAMPVVGYSATPWRLKQGHLLQGNIFTKMAFDNTQREAFVELIDDGYLCPLIPKSTSFQFDLSKVRHIGGDFNQGDLQKAVDVDELSEQALQEALQCAPHRNHWLIFCSGIDHVESVTSMLEAWGESVVCVHSKMGETRRDLAIDQFKRGEARMMVNDGILTTGFNDPKIDCIVLLRPTESPGLHVQILGRGTRPYFATGYDIETTQGRLDAIAASPKQNCLVLDFAGNTGRLGPINDPRVPKQKGKGMGEVPIKICPKCASYVHAAQRFCDGLNWDNTRCNYEFEFTTKLEQTAATEELIVRDVPQLVWFKVDRVEYEVFTKPFSPAMMRVKYFCGLRRFTELVCVEHQTYAGKIARDWWRLRLRESGYGPDVGPPPNTQVGMTAVHMLRTPTNIYVHVNLKYPRITAVTFDGTTPMHEVAGRHG